MKKKKLICLLNTLYSVSVVEEDSTIVPPANQVYTVEGKGIRWEVAGCVSCCVTQSDSFSHSRTPFSYLTNKGLLWMSFPAHLIFTMRHKGQEVLFEAKGQNAIAQRSANDSPWPGPSAAYFFYTLWAKNGFYIFKWFKKIFLKNTVLWQVKIT